MNVLYQPLPEEWNGYKFNTDFQIGIQIMLVMEDPDFTENEKAESLICLLFSDSKNHLHKFPKNEELVAFIKWYTTGWSYDKESKSNEKMKLLDFNVDQWRIYADFKQIYGINLNDCEMHWWEFMGLLWNMPEKTSSFLQVINIRKTKITSKMSADQKEQIQKMQSVYSLEQKEERKYSEDQKEKIDNFDAWMAEARKKAEQKQQIINDFNRR